MTIVHVETSRAEREAAKMALIRVLNELAQRHKSDLVVKVQLTTDNSLSQEKGLVTR